MSQSKPSVNIISALQKKDRGIGNKGALPWRIPEDLKRFKEITSSHPIIMGRKTFEAIGRPLPNRANIIITRNPEYKKEGCSVVNSLEDAIQLAAKYDAEKVFVIGGGEIYKEALKYADKLYLTEVEDEQEVDAYFPNYAEFSEVVFMGGGEQNGIKYEFLELTRPSATS